MLNVLCGYVFESAALGLVFRREMRAVLYFAADPDNLTHRQPDGRLRNDTEASSVSTTLLARDLKPTVLGSISITRPGSG